jgi:hypothetical protein
MIDSLEKPFEGLPKSWITYLSQGSGIVPIGEKVLKFQKFPTLLLLVMESVMGFVMRIFIVQNGVFLVITIKGHPIPTWTRSGERGSVESPLVM